MQRERGIVRDRENRDQRIEREQNRERAGERERERES